jgi:hypothetical protein
MSRLSEPCHIRQRESRCQGIKLTIVKVQYVVMGLVSGVALAGYNTCFSSHQRVAKCLRVTEILCNGALDDDDGGRATSCAVGDIMGGGAPQAGEGAPACGVELAAMGGMSNIDDVPGIVVREA